jgi:choline dehydrogenase-like flavoprotein
MPTSAGRNPTLTAQALAWRTAEKIVSDWDEIAR